MKTAKELHEKITKAGIELPLVTVEMVRSVVLNDLHAYYIDSNQPEKALELLKLWQPESFNTEKNHK